MTVETLTDAIRVLEQTQHRGARGWYYDRGLLRVMPTEWNGQGGWKKDLAEPAPAFTRFETLAIARGLEQIGAVGPWGAPPLPWRQLLGLMDQLGMGDE